MKNRLIIKKPYFWIGVALLLCFAAAHVLSWTALYFEYSSPFDPSPNTEYLKNVYASLFSRGLFLSLALLAILLFTAVQEVVWHFTKNAIWQIVLTAVKYVTAFSFFCMTLDLWFYWGIWPESLPRLFQVLTFLTYVLLTVFEIKEVLSPPSKQKSTNLLRKRVIF